MITHSDLINYLDTVCDFTEAGVITIKMLGVLAAVADEKLRASGIATGVSHGEYPAIMVLVITVQFAVNFVARATGARHAGRTGARVRASSLDDKVRNNTVESEAIIEAFISQFDEIGYGIGGVLVVKFYFQCAFVGLNGCFGQNSLAFG